MADEATTPAEGATAAAPETAAPNTTPPQAETQGKTFTQEQLDQILAERLERDRATRKREWDAETKKREERAKMAEAERLAAEKADLEKQLEAAKAETRTAHDRATLAGHVAPEHLDKATRLIEDSHRKADGTLDAAKFLKDNPFLKATPDPRPGPAPTTAGGGAPLNAPDMNAAIRSKAGRT